MWAVPRIIPNTSMVSAIVPNDPHTVAPAIHRVANSMVMVFSTLLNTSPREVIRVMRDSPSPPRARSAAQTGVASSTVWRIPPTPHAPVHPMKGDTLHRASATLGSRLPSLVVTAFFTAGTAALVIFLATVLMSSSFHVTRLLDRTSSAGWPSWPPQQRHC